MSKTSIIYGLLSVLLIAYLSVALAYAGEDAKTETFRGLSISVANNKAAGFVTVSDIDAELGNLSSTIKHTQRSALNTLQVEQSLLASLDNVERVNCCVLGDGTLQVDVTPLEPVARVFDTSNGRSYYINRDGRKMRATSRYRLDLPVVTGHFGTRRSASMTLPVLDYLDSHPEYSHMAEALKVDRKGDIILIPAIKGHVINLGDTTELGNKFRRLAVFYRKVMPVKGWEYYDTLSVKFRDRMVAKIHDWKAAPPVEVPLDEDYIDDPETMLTGGESV